jgi:hypothetical protein
MSLSFVLFVRFIIYLVKIKKKKLKHVLPIAIEFAPCVPLFPTPLPPTINNILGSKYYANEDKYVVLSLTNSLK